METWLLVMDLSHSRFVDAVVLHTVHSVSSFWDSCWLRVMNIALVDHKRSEDHGDHTSFAILLATA